MTQDNGKFVAGGGTLALGIIGTALSGLLATGGGNGLLGGLGWNNHMWSDREVCLQRQIDALAASQAVTAAVTPYQISEATCNVVRTTGYIPANDIVYSYPNNNCF